MLPRVALRQVTREDVCRLLGWLRDEEVSSRWFRKYASGEPAHHGYDPIYMLETSEDEWNEVLRHHSQMLVFSVYSEADGHIGECQLQVNGSNDAEVFLLIGRKDIWNQGYGTSALMAILDQAFSYYRLEQVWAKVPETNAPALGLFERLGFAFECTSLHRTEPDGTSIRAFRMSMASTAYREHQGRVGRQSRGPVVTVTGLAGAGSEAVAAEVAQLTGARFVDDEIPKRMCQRLERSIGELEALEASYSSIRARILRFLVAPWESYGPFSMSPDELVTWTSIEFYLPQEYLTKEQYLKGLKGVISELSLEGNVVVHGHGSHLSAPSRVKTIHSEDHPCVC
jgi:RimJ/RimL family protein N-acetyltransferase